MQEAEEMLNVKADTVIVGVSELRTHLEEILKKTEHMCVAIARRNQVVGMLLSLKQYEEMEEMLDLAEDIALGYLAKDRERKKAARKYLTLEEVEKRLGARR